MNYTMQLERANLRQDSMTSVIQSEKKFPKYNPVNVSS